MSISDGNLRELIRLIPPARALKEQLDESIHLDLFTGTGDAAVTLFQGLQASIARICDDPYVSSLALKIPADASDKQKVALARLAAGQLLAFLEGQTGLASPSGKGGGGRHIQTAPNINISGVPSGGTLESIMEFAFKKKKEAQERQKPE